MIVSVLIGWVIGMGVAYLAIRTLWWWQDRCRDADRRFCRDDR